MIKHCLIVLACGLAMASPGQTPFHAYSNSVEMLEGGKVDTLEILTGNERLTVRLPRGFAGSVDEENRRVVYTDKTGAMSITLQVTTNWPGTLPADELLRSRAMAANPGGIFLLMAGNPTAWRPAKYVDSVRKLEENITIKRRHAFIPCPEGIVELVLSANSANFEKGRLAFGLMLSSFQLQPVKPLPAVPATNSTPAP